MPDEHYELQQDAEEVAEEAKQLGEELLTTVNQSADFEELKNSTLTALTKLSNQVQGIAETVQSLSNRTQQDAWTTEDRVHEILNNRLSELKSPAEAEPEQEAPVTVEEEPEPQKTEKRRKGLFG